MNLKESITKTLDGVNNGSIKIEETTSMVRILIDYEDMSLPLHKLEKIIDDVGSDVEFSCSNGYFIITAYAY